MEKQTVEDSISNTNSEALLVWQKPEMQRLVIGFDTAATAKNGSAADGGTFDGFVGAPPD